MTTEMKAVPQSSLLVPAYFYPHGSGLVQWDRLIASAKLSMARIIVVLNPANGPGHQVDANYKQLLDRISQTQLIPVGYITTSYANRSLNALKAEVDRWLRLYPSIQGVFFDEQSSAAEHVTYQARLYRHVRHTRRLNWVIANPGTVCDEGFVKEHTADITCLYEGAWSVNPLETPDWLECYEPQRTAALLYGVRQKRQMRSLLRKVMGAGFGNLYLTDAATAMPWGRLPRYWEDEIGLF